MPFETKFTMTATCDECGTERRETCYGSFLNAEPPDDAAPDFLINLSLEGWEVERTSYEGVELYCPKCKGDA